jgi:hypothetical protein
VALTRLPRSRTDFEVKLLLDHYTQPSKLLSARSVVLSVRSHVCLLLSHLFLFVSFLFPFLFVNRQQIAANSRGNSFLDRLTKSQQYEPPSNLLSSFFCF